MASVISLVAVSSLVSIDGRALAIAFVIIVAFLLVANAIGFVVDSIQKAIKQKRENEWKAIHRCKGITLKGEQCLNYDCSIRHKATL